MKRRRLFSAVVLGSLVWGAGFAHALDPMRVSIRTGLPKEVKTIGQAAQYFGDTIGYQLTLRHPAPAESAAIARERLSPLARKTEVKAVEDAILSLLGPECALVIDHEHKLFSFEKREEK